MKYTHQITINFSKILDFCSTQASVLALYQNNMKYLLEVEMGLPYGRVQR